MSSASSCGSERRDPGLLLHCILVGRHFVIVVSSSGGGSPPLYSSLLDPPAAGSLWASMGPRGKGSCPNTLSGSCLDPSPTCCRAALLCRPVIVEGSCSAWHTWCGRRPFESILARPPGAPLVRALLSRASACSPSYRLPPGVPSVRLPASHFGRHPLRPLLLALSTWQALPCPKSTSVSRPRQRTCGWAASVRSTWPVSRPGCLCGPMTRSGSQRLPRRCRVHRPSGGPSPPPPSWLPPHTHTHVRVHPHTDTHTHTCTAVRTML